jgi:hypothetical protein
MRARRRTNLLVGAIALAVALVVAAQALGLIPAPALDVIVRAWPVVLVVVGLSLLLRGRLPLAGLLALIVSLALAAGIGAYAFSARSQEQRTDYEETISQPISAGLGLLRIRVMTLATDVEVLRAVDAGAGIQGVFVGSTESRVAVDYDEPGDGSATFTLRETRPNPFPMLEALGRGQLRLELPAGIPLDVEVIGDDGAVTLNMRETALERMNLDLARGDALVIIPAYQPVSGGQGGSQGTLAVRDGAITLVVPSSVAARLELDRGGSGIEPEYDPGVYNFLFNRVLESRTIEIAETVVRFNITAPRGRVRLQVEPIPAAS